MITLVLASGSHNYAQRALAMMKYVLVLSIVSIASCSSDRKTEVDNFYDDLAVPPANKDADRLDGLSPPIDTSLITAINYLKDSLITSRHRFAQM